MHLYDTSQIRSHLNPPKSVYPQAHNLLHTSILNSSNSESTTSVRVSFLVRKRPVNKVAHMTLR